MREILFRAWDKRRNIYGKVIMLEQWECQTQIEANYGHKGRVTLENPLNDVDCGSWGSWIEFVGLEQFTGLLDKNCVKIFEGDIVKIKNSNYKMIFDKGCFVLNGYDNGDFYSGKDLTETDYNKPSVIGNIHEIKELLG